MSEIGGEAKVIKRLWRESAKVGVGTHDEMSYREIERQAGLTKDTFARIISGKRRVSTDDLLAIADFFGVQPQVIRPGFPWGICPAKNQEETE